MMERQPHLLQRGDEKRSEKFGRRGETAQIGSKNTEEWIA